MCLIQVTSLSHSHFGLKSNSSEHILHLCVELHLFLWLRQKHVGRKKPWVQARLCLEKGLSLAEVLVQSAVEILLHFHATQSVLNL